MQSLTSQQSLHDNYQHENDPRDAHKNWIPQNWMQIMLPVLHLLILLLTRLTDAPADARFQQWYDQLLNMTAQWKQVHDQPIEAAKIREVNALLRRINKLILKPRETQLAEQQARHVA